MLKPVWVAGVLLALTAGSVAARPAGFELRLIEPAAHAEVVAGSSVPVAWDAASVPAGIEEWEAFLSIDGGRTYPMRITPHLDAGIRRFNWIVPSLPGAEVSLLLRFGDERRELEVPFIARVRIASALLPERLRKTAGTMIRKRETVDDHGQTLTSWVEGSRLGLDLRQVACGDETYLGGAADWTIHRHLDAITWTGTSSKRLDGALSAAADREHHPSPLRHEPPRPIPHHRSGVLLLTGRLNI